MNDQPTKGKHRGLSLLASEKIKFGRGSEVVVVSFQTESPSHCTRTILVAVRILSGVSGVSIVQAIWVCSRSRCAIGIALTSDLLVHLGNIHLLTGR